jgi:nucleotide-binding universal stress UspA family protein
MKRIVAALDFSNATAGVLEQATALARAFGAELKLVHVLEPEPTYTAYGFTPDEFPAIHTFQEEARKRARTKLEESAAGLPDDLPSIAIELAEGSPLQALVEYLKEVDADLVIVGSHGHGVVASLLIGSVAEGIVRKAVVPTLVVPAPGRE